MSKRARSVLMLIATLALAGCGSSGGDNAAEDAGTVPADDSGAAAGSGASPTSGGPGNGTQCAYPSDDQLPAPRTVDPPPGVAAYSGQLTAEMETTIGTFGLTLDADAAPCTVNSFVSLAQQGYFDDTICQRLTTADSGIAILQCGDPGGTGTGGPGYTFPDELTGSETYGAGTLAMANRGPETNGSQFFIVYGDSQLGPSYTVFGTVDEATITAVTDLAAQGVDDLGNYTAPKTPVEVGSVTVQ